MEKIKITVKQERLLEDYKEFCEFQKSEPFARRVSSGDSWGGLYADLKEFTPEQFALLLCGWYEVEQPFKVEDWVYDKGLEEYRKIGNDNYIFGKYNTVSVRVVWNEPDEFEKVTDPWKIMLLELGREKPEFHKDDVIVTESEVYEAEYLTDEEIIVLFEKDLVRAFHAAEHRIEVKGHDS